MNLWRIAWKYMWDKKLTTTLTILSVALAVGLISAILTIRDETRKRFEEEQLVYDVVIGPPGSPLQLVLNAVYYLDQPIGAIPYTVYEDILKRDDVTHAFPIGLGDTYQNYRIVGTVKEMFDFPWESPSTGELRYPLRRLAEGRVFEDGMEAVVGYRPARENNLRVGDQIKGTHGGLLPGEEDPHEDDYYTVVGILEPTGTSADRAVFVPLQSVWDIHEHHGEDEDDHGHGDEPKTITAILVDLYSPAQQFTFQREVMDEFGVTAAVPVIQVLYFYRQVLQPVVALLMGVGYVVVIIAALSILVGLYLSIIQRKRDLAIMRALGASAGEIFGAVIIEAFLVAVIGIAAGWVIGKATAYVLGAYITQAYGLAITGLSTGPDELRFFAMVALVGILAGILPAWQAYRVDVAQDLTAT